MTIKKFIATITLIGLALTAGCSSQPEASETKADPVTLFAAVQTAVALTQAIWERNSAVTQTDVNTILDALRLATQELAAHQDRLHIQTEVATVEGLARSFERYSVIRTDGVQLNALLIEVERSFSQLKSILVNQRVYDSYIVAPAFNTLAAIRVLADMDYMRSDVRVRDIAREVAGVNNRLLASPSFPVYTSNQHGPMVFEDCKVMTAPFRADQRDHILYSALSTWTMGYHKGREFRYYHNQKFTGSCYENDRGTDAYHPGFKNGHLSLSYTWETIAPRMYEDNLRALRENEIYRSTRTAQDAFMPLVKAFDKQGNNGTVSCGTYCAGAEWGRTGTCLGGVLSKDDTIVSCKELPGLLREGQFTCQCLD